MQAMGSACIICTERPVERVMLKCVSWGPSGSRYSARFWRVSQGVQAPRTAFAFFHIL